MDNLEKNLMEEKELIEMMQDNGPEWMEGFAALMRAADGATPAQIVKAVEFLEEKKTERTKARLENLIKEGEQLLGANSADDMTAWEFMILKKISNDDAFMFANNAFMMGVAIGHSISANNAEKSKKTHETC